MNDKADTVAMAHNLTETGKEAAFDGLGPLPYQDICTDRSRGGNRHHEAKAAGMGGTVTTPVKRVANFGIDYDAATLDYVMVNGMRFVPIVDRGHADTEGEAMASFDHLNCPACGGSGHVDDVKPASPVPHDRLSLVFPDASCATIARGVQAVAEALTLPHAVVAMAEELVRAEDDCRVLSDTVAIEVTRRDKAERKLADMTTNRDALSGECFNLNLRDEASTSTIQAMTSRVVDLTAERDAAAENARRERDRRGTYSDDTLKTCEDNLLYALKLLGTDGLLLDNGAGPRKRGALVENVLRCAGLVSRNEEKPVVRVVTSPRFYGDEDHQRAADELSRLILNTNRTGDLGRRCKDYVTTVAAALGMRRAES